MKVRLPNAAPALCAKTLRVHEKLCAQYNCPIAYFHTLDPLSELISSLLSHRTKNADSSRAFQKLRAQFPDWSQVLAAPVEQIEQAISPCTWPEQKAPRLLQVLATIENERGELSENALDFLGEIPVAEARDWLEKLPGVGPKTSAAVMAFSRLRGRALPVDSHHHRVAARLGLIAENVAVGPSHAILESLLPQSWNAQQVYDHHEVLMLHGQNCCFFRNPACARCAVRDECDFYAQACDEKR